MNSLSSNPFLLCEATKEQHILAHEFTIGRSLSSSLVLEDNNRVSRNHGALNLESGIFHYVDLNSANGSWIGINRLEPGKPYALQHGAVIKIAGRQFTFCEREDPTLFDRTVLTRSGRLTELVRPSASSSEEDIADLLTRQQANLKQRLDLIEGGDTELLASVRQGLDRATESSHDALFKCRAITQRTLEIIRKAEFTDGKIPESYLASWREINMSHVDFQPVYFKPDDKIWQGVVPQNPHKLLQLLNCMTGIKKVKPVAQFTTKEIYFLVLSMSQVAGPAGHEEEGYFNEASFALAKMNEAVTLCELLNEELAQNK